MDYTKTERLLMIKFLSDYREAIKEEYVKNQGIPGFVFAHVDQNFEPKEKFIFIPRKIEEEQFTNLFEEETGRGTTTGEGNWMYYEIFWGSKRVTWRIKEKINK